MVLGGVALGGVYAPQAVVFVSLTLEILNSHLGMVTLFIERAQEVILTNWRAHSSEACSLAIRDHELRIEKAKQDGEQDRVNLLFDELLRLKQAK